MAILTLHCNMCDKHHFKRSLYVQSTPVLIITANHNQVVNEGYY